jgi:hypothetical protein
MHADYPLGGKPEMGQGEQPQWFQTTPKPPVIGNGSRSSILPFSNQKVKVIQVLSILLLSSAPE